MRQVRRRLNCSDPATRDAQRRGPASDHASQAQSTVTFSANGIIRVTQANCDSSTSGDRPLEVPRFLANRIRKGCTPNVRPTRFALACWSQPKFFADPLCAGFALSNTCDWPLNWPLNRWFNCPFNRRFSRPFSCPFDVFFLFHPLHLQDHHGHCQKSRPKSCC
jgi:hypothetical protein